MDSKVYIQTIFVCVCVFLSPHIYVEWTKLIILKKESLHYVLKGLHLRKFSKILNSNTTPNQFSVLYSRFQVTFQSAFPKFVLNIPNYITKFRILRENVQSEICMLAN